jgi:pimeloyl-ACP methyl ester carboxylesterase
MPHYYQFYTDFVENETRLNIESALKNTQIPHLIIHGTSDEAVSFSEAKELHKWNPDSSLLPIENANHVFGGKHPWEGNTLPKDLESVCNETIRFLQPYIPS